jgi:hypothetical protein
MSRITSWTDDAKQDFLRWLGKGKHTVEFLTAPKVAVTIGKESGTYCVETSGMGFVLRDAFDTGQAIKLDTENEECDAELKHEDVAAECSWTEWSGKRQQAIDEILYELQEEYIPVVDRQRFRELFTEAVFILSNMSVRHLTAEVLNSRSPVLSLWAMAMVFNLSCVEGRTQEEIANQCGVSKAALSKHVKEMQQRFKQDCAYNSRYSYGEPSSVAFSDREKLKQ